MGASKDRSPILLEATLEGRNTIVLKKLLISAVVSAFATVAVLGIGSADAVAKDTVRVGHFSWPGYGFFRVLAAKNLDPDLEFEFTLLEDPVQLFSLLATDQLDIVTSTIEFGPIAAAEDMPMKLVAYTNISYGTDKIILHPDIKSVSDLKGETVAVLEGGLAQIYMAIWLEQNGVAWDEVNMANLIMNDAAAAMISGHVAAGEFWDPWGTNVLNDLEGAQLAAQSRDPFWLESGLLADAMYYSDSFINDRRDVAVKSIAAYYDAVEYWRSNVAEGNQIIAEALQFSIEDVELVLGKDNPPEDAGLYVYSLEDTARFCGVADGDPPYGQHNGQMYDHWKLTNEWWINFGLMSEMVDDAKGLDCSILGDAYKMATGG
jgi:NitT/TauT family transport system substrate-binding protein